MKIDTRLDLSLNVGRKSVRALDVELHSYDRDYHEFEIAFINLELKPTDRVQVLAVFEESERTSLDEATIRDGKAYYSFDTALIDIDENVTCYVYLKTDTIQAEVDAFKFYVDLSEIDEDSNSD